MRWDEIVGRDGQLLRDVQAAGLDVNRKPLVRVLLLAIKISREGREDRKAGTMFVVSDVERTLRHSQSSILDPLWHHPNDRKRLDVPNLRETVKELAQLDGAFIVSDEGVVLSACRYINASSEGIDLTLGLGSRHMAAASVTNQTDAVAVVVSETSVVRVFDDGEIISKIIPESWLLKRHGMNLSRIPCSAVARHGSE
jgi:DNA integrity scanning protein DisA with diadenylate cyclase activity